MVQRVEGTLQRSYLERLFALAAKFYQIMMVRSRSVTELILELLDHFWNCDDSLFWHQLSSALSDLQGHFDPGHPQGVSVPAVSAVFCHHLSLAVSRLSNTQMPEVQGTKPPPCSRDPLPGFSTDYAPRLQAEDARV